MKVIKVGNKRPKPEKTRKEKCPYCGSVIKFTESEIHGYSSDYEEDAITCPVCEKEFVVEYKGYGRTY